MSSLLRIIIVKSVAEHPEEHTEENPKEPEESTHPLLKTKYVRHVKSNNWEFGLVKKRDKMGRKEIQSSQKR